MPRALFLLDRMGRRRGGGDRATSALAATLAAFAALTPVACGGEAPEARWAGTVDTLPGGVVMVRNPAEGLWGDAPPRLVESLRIGAVEGSGPDQFGSVRDVALDELGRIWVLDNQAAEVRVFEPDGEHVRTVGRSGEGPGELGQPLALEWGPRGRLWIIDFGNRRYEVFDTTGVRATSHPILAGSFGFGNRWSLDGFLNEQVALGGPERRTVMIRRQLDGDSLAVVDTLPAPETHASETIPITTQAGGNTFSFDLPVPLAPASEREGDPRAGWWLSDPGTAYRIARLSPQGDTLRIIERAYEPVPVTAEQRQIALEELPEGVASGDVPVPDVHPPIIDLSAGREQLWVKRRTAADRTGYDVFDDTGRYLGELQTEIPLDRFTLYDRRGDTVVGVLLDDLDIPYVLRLSVVQ